MNPVIHFEIPVEETGKAADFYREVLGWEMNEMGYGDAYLAAARTSSVGLFSIAPGAINGAIGRKGVVTPDRPTVVVRVEDIDKVLEGAKEHGGMVFREKSPVGDSGFAAYFSDPEGNLIGLWQDTRE